MPDERKLRPEHLEGEPLNSPYGPQRGHVDEAAGGADSSPRETEAAGEREDSSA